MNVALSTASPFLLLPIVRQVIPDDRKYEWAVVLFLAITLMWPQALILASHNLKDVLTQFLTSLYLLILWSFALRDPERKMRSGEILKSTLALGITLLLLFSLRTYLAVILAAVSMLLLAPRRPVLALLGLASMVIFYFAFQDRLVGFIYDNWLFNADARESLLQDAFSRGDVRARVNVEPLEILGSAVRFFLGPFPSAGGTGYQWLLVIQSAAMYFFAYFSIKGARRFPPSIKGYVIILCLFLALLYGIAELISGPRQRFAPFDYLFLMFATVGLVSARQHEFLYGVLGFSAIYFFARFVF
jgi:hypothetical protein